jgi:hypothetical protein
MSDGMGVKSHVSKKHFDQMPTCFRKYKYVSRELQWHQMCHIIIYKAEIKKLILNNS